MTKPKTLEQLRADKERDRDAACTGTAQAGASGERKEVSGTGRTGRNFDRNGKDHAARRGRDASEQRHAWAHRCSEGFLRSSEAHPAKTQKRQSTPF